MKKFFTIFMLTILSTALIAGMGSYNSKNIKSKSTENVLSATSKHSLTFQQLVPWAGVYYAPPCPDPLVFDLDPGACGVVVNNFGFSFPSFVTTPLSTVSTINSTVVNSTKYCSSGQTVYRRTFQHTGPTDMRIASITVGVYESVNNPLVKFNFYTLSGDLIGNYVATVPNLNRSLYTANIPAGVNIMIPAGSSYIMEVVANAPYISIFKMGMNDAGYAPGTGALTVTASNCPVSFNQEIWSGAPGVTPSEAIFYITGVPNEYKYINVLNNYKEGDFFPIGITPLAFNIIDANGVTTTCAFNVVVNEYNSGNNALACNDLIQVSMDGDCEVEITPEMVLEGDHYGCFGKYVVVITGKNGQNLGNKVTRANIGQRLEVKIIAPDGNSCWGEILVEDKLGPQLVCGNIYANCESDLSPGSKLSSLIPVAADILPANKNIGTTDSERKDIDIQVGNFPDGTTITKLDVFLDITHADVSQLSAQITSPDGTTVPLFLGLSCNGNNIMATFDDDGIPVDCQGAVTPAVAGRFQPVNSLSVFVGQPLTGIWRVSIFDHVSGTGGTINNVHLIFNQSGAYIPFPTNNEVTSVKVDNNTYLVKGIDNCVDATMVFKDEVVEEDCASIYSKVIKRCWTGTDQGGNLATPCCQYIYIYRNSLSTMTFPPNFDGLGSNPPALSCFDYGKIIPPVSVTGVPQGHFCDNVQITDPVDARIDICENSYKIIRTHKVLEWCSGSVIIHNQIIKVMDNEGPELKCPEDVTISTDANSCDAVYAAVRPEIIRECSENLTYTLSYNSYDINEDDFVTAGVNQKNGTITSLNLGVNWVKWTVTDACGNSSECIYKVTVIDDVRPVAVCDKHSVASLSGNGRAIVKAESLDDGSSDNCGVLRFDARKMTDKCGIGTTKFTPEIEFCCEEVGTTVMVEMRVTDVHGNTNVCMVEVKVDDKLPPYITKCPADITLDCNVDYENIDITGYPEYVDNCGIDRLSRQDDKNLNHCGEGTITRTWTVIDKQGYKNSCVQVITMVNKNPFKESDIRWPLNYETEKCYSELTPESLPSGYNKPVFKEVNCGLVAASYKDQVFKLIDGACEKIIRTWTVLDWCTYNEVEPTLGQGWYEYIQVIKIVNKTAPVFIGSSGSALDGCTDRTIPAYGNCEGEVEIRMYAKDDCNDNENDLIWHYTVYAEDGLTQLYSGSTHTFRRTMPIGKYVIKWIVEDKCGNRAYCTQNVNVIESKKPTPYCITYLTTTTMNSDGTALIWAKDFDKDSYDNCTPKSELWFTFFGATPVLSKINEEHYFKGNGVLATELEYRAGIAQRWIPSMKSSGRMFTCADIPNGISQQISLDMTVTDLAGNQDYCTVTIILQDNANVCPDNSNTKIVVSGRAVSNGHDMKHVEVTLASNKPEYNRSIYTDNKGQFVLDKLNKGYDYTVSLSDNNDIMNGVSTLDLVLIQRHILGLELLGSPELIIASDADNSGRVTASDLTVIRKLILGITTQFPNGQKSWRFINQGQTFANNQSPFPFAESYSYSNLTENKSNQNFIGIKIGDVNQSATYDLNNPVTESRSKDVLVLTNQINRDEDGLISVDIKTSEVTEMSGYQFTMEFNPEAYELSDIVFLQPGMDESNFGMNRMDAGIITTSWHKESPFTLSKDAALFTLKFRAKATISGDIVKISSKVTPAVAYDQNLVEKDVKLMPRTVASSYELMQNKPNPFHASTQIEFVLPEAADATITIMDITGKIVKSIQAFYHKGINAVTVTTEDLGSTGVFMYKIDSGNFTDTKKMIILE
ncbi:MAG: T9SS type A sorting domain-containing protein [Chitinophagales bacterium]|nr:T9SS type A sorting domain-containing protein [Chitinophagales bacterium]